MSNFFMGVVCSIVCLNLGNWLGDQATLRDCATKLEAKMMGGGVIECTVLKESK